MLVYKVECPDEKPIYFRSIEDAKKFISDTVNLHLDQYMTAASDVGWAADNLKVVLPTFVLEVVTVIDTLEEKLTQEKLTCARLNGDVGINGLGSF